MHHDPVATALAMLAAGRDGDAIALVGRAAAAGDGAALFQQAMWHLIGRPLPRDLPRARQTLRQARERGHGEAMLVEIALTANGSGAPADWGAAVALLRDAAATGNAHAAALQAMIAAMDLDADGAPVAPIATEPMNADGRVRRAPRLLTAAECGHVARSASDLLTPAVVVDPATGRNVPHPIRTSDAAVIGPIREDPVIGAINRRLACASGTPVEAGEALTVLRYAPGQQFRLHSDALPATRNQRVTTVLVYLNDGFAGGETVFPDLGLSIAPRMGDAVIFNNVDATGRVLPAARHAGAPVTRGTKWLATRWIRARPFSVWTGPEA